MYTLVYCECTHCLLIFKQCNFKSMCSMYTLKTSDTQSYQSNRVLSCQPRVTVMSCFVYEVIRDLESMDHLCINPILWIGLIHM